jgi:hypothetical protein
MRVCSGVSSCKIFFWPLFSLSPLEDEKIGSNNLVFIIYAHAMHGGVDLVGADMWAKGSILIGREDREGEGN